MLTPQDIKNLIEAEKEVFVTKEDLAHTDSKIDILLTNLTGLLKSSKLSRKSISSCANAWKSWKLGPKKWPTNSELFCLTNYILY